MNNMQKTLLLGATAFVLAAQGTMLTAASVPDPLPDPDGKPADMSKPVKVFILMGQSNMLGFGQTAGLKAAAEKYPYLFDDAGNWTVCKDVRNVRVMNFKDYFNDWLSGSNGSGARGGSFGPEIGIGYYVGYVLNEPVLLLKSCIGNRSLGWDLLPPGSEPYEFDGKMYPGYRGTPDNPQGNGQKVEGQWYAGKQYDDDIESAKQVLSNLGKYYPGAKEYEVAGFLWWQGDKDMRNPAHYTRYEQNLEQLMVALRKAFNTPQAKFVFASLGQTQKGSKKGDGVILDAMESVAGKHPGEAAFVYTHPLSMGGSSSGHYSKHAETYMNVGEAMGKAMAGLLVGSGGAGNASAGRAATDSDTLGEMRTWTSQSGSTVKAKLVSARTYDVILEKADGTKLKIGRTSLSQADQDYLQSR